MDIVDRETRSRMMSSIRSRNTRPEILFRHALHFKGFRYRLHRKDLPGTPDLVLARYRALIYIHGCFWHGHDCSLFKWPQTRKDFWRQKIDSNRVRDRRNIDDAIRQGWRVCVVWECALKGKTMRTNLPNLIDIVAGWLKSSHAPVMVSLDAGSCRNNDYDIVSGDTIAAAEKPEIRYHHGSDPK